MDFYLSLHLWAIQILIFAISFALLQLQHFLNKIDHYQLYILVAKNFTQINSRTNLIIYD